MTSGHSSLGCRSVRSLGRVDDLPTDTSRPFPSRHRACASRLPRVGSRAPALPGRGTGAPWGGIGHTEHDRHQEVMRTPTTDRGSPERAANGSPGRFMRAQLPAPPTAGVKMPMTRTRSGCVAHSSATLILTATHRFLRSTRFGDDGRRFLQLHARQDLPHPVAERDLPGEEVDPLRRTSLRGQPRQGGDDRSPGITVPPRCLQRRELREGHLPAPVLLLAGSCRPTTGSRAGRPSTPAPTSSSR